MLSPIEEVQFWTGIMRDHGEFILTSLSYNEQEAMNYANFYKVSFQQLHERSKQLVGQNDINSLLNECTNLLISFINFKRHLLGRLLQCQLDTSLPPTFYNHMINEAMQFYGTLVNIQSNAPVNPVFRNIEMHKTWLPDAAGHAATIACRLDPVEKPLVKEAQEFEKCFNNLAIKAEELGRMLLRTGLTDGVLGYFNEEVRVKINDFISYLDKIRRLRLECEVMGVLVPLVPDHMIREENHYLREIEAANKMK